MFGYLAKKVIKLANSHAGKFSDLYIHTGEFENLTQFATLAPLAPRALVIYF